MYASSERKLVEVRNLHTRGPNEFTEGRAISEGQARGTMDFRACNTTYAEWTNVKVATVDGSVCTNGRERTLRTALEDRDQEPASARSPEHMKRASRCIL